MMFNRHACLPLIALALSIGLASGAAAVDAAVPEVARSPAPQSKTEQLNQRELEAVQAQNGAALASSTFLGAPLMRQSIAAIGNVN